jgi:predicted O-methyltransferase YrrM
MSENPSKSLVLQELEVLENFLRGTSQREISAVAFYIFKQVKINIAKLKKPEEKALAPRYMAVLDRVKPYLVLQTEKDGTPYEHPRKCWGYGILDGISSEQIQWSEKQKTNYDECNFTDIEFYDEEILANIEKYLPGKIEGTDYNRSEMSYKDRAFLNGIIRKLKPETIVEIGLGAGGSSCVILNAIHDMENTKLYSFDYNTIWYRDKGLDKGRKTGFLVNEIVPDFISKWELYTGGVPCKYFDKIPLEGIDICLIDTAHFNPGEHLNILEVLPFMKKNGIVIYHDIAYHSLSNTSGTTCCVSLNTLNGKRILLKSEHTMGLPNIGAIILDENIEDMLFSLFSNISLPWHYKITDADFIEIFKHFSKYYSKNLVKIYVFYCYFYMNGGHQNKKFANIIAENAFLDEKIKNAKVIHFHLNDKFANPTIHFINKYFKYKEHLHLVYRLHNDAYSAQEFPTGENVMEVNYEMLNPIILKDKKLIFHSLFVQNNIKMLYSHQNLLRHSYWMVWGGDLYNAPSEYCNDFVRKNIYGIGSFCDAELVKKKYSSSHKFFVTNLAIAPIEKNSIYEAMNRVKKSNSVVIQINNSADYTTLEMLDVLSKFKDENIKIRTVLSYGNTNYSQEIIEKGKRLFSEKFSYLEKMIPPKNYVEYLAANNILILCQNRQQGGATTCSSLLAGKKVFIKSNIITSKWLHDLGAVIFDTNKISEMDFAEFISFDPSIAEKNRCVIDEKVYNDEFRVNHEFKPVFDDDCFAHSEAEA